MNRHLLLATSLLLVTIASLLAFSSTALAHERRAVGNYTFVVGFLTEPAIVDEPNAIDLRVTRTSDSSPVTGLEQTLKAEISSEGSSEKLLVELRPRFGTPGAYDGRFMPTKAGAYAFRIYGTLEGTQVDERFTSSDSTFSSVAAPVAFPQPAASSQEVNESLQGIEARLASLEDDDNADGAMIVAILGVVLGAAGLGTAAFSLTRKGNQS
jgi:hypothetical protein